MACSTNCFITFSPSTPLILHEAILYSVTCSIATIFEINWLQLPICFPLAPWGDLIILDHFIGDLVERGLYRYFER